MAFDKDNDVVFLAGEGFISIPALISLLATAKPMFIAKGLEIGQEQYGAGAGFACDELRVQLMKFLAVDSPS